MIARLVGRISRSGVRLREVGTWHFPELGEAGIEDLYLTRTEHYTAYKYLPLRFNRSVTWRVRYKEYGTPMHQTLDNTTRKADEVIDTILYGY